MNLMKLKKSINFLLVISIVVISILLVSCNNSANSNTGNSNGNGNDNTNNSQNGQRQIDNADVYGEIKSISGDKVTLSLLEQPQMGRPRNNEDLQNNDNDKQPPENMPEKSPGENDQKPEATEGERRGNGGPGGMRFEKTYTGETKEVTINDSIKIVSMQMSENGMQENEIQVTDLKEGQILQVWYKEGSDSEIENIRVMEIQDKNNTEETKTSESENTDSV